MKHRRWTLDADAYYIHYQNGFDSFVGNFATPLIRPNVYANLAGDLPNRFLVWGNLNVPFKEFKIFPIVEYRNGFPWMALDAH